MKRKLRQHNQAWLSMQLRRAKNEGAALSFFINFSSIRAAACNGERLQQRGRLTPNWDRALFYPGWGEVPIVGPKGTVYWFKAFNKEDLPVKFLPLWTDA